MDRAYKQRINTAVSYADIKAILKQIGIQYIQRSQSLWFRCINPNHKADKKPSVKIVIDPDSEYYGIWYCFGCHAKGSIISLVQLAWNISFSESLVLVESHQLQHKYHNKNTSGHNVQITLPKYYNSPKTPKEWNEKYLSYLKSRNVAWHTITKYKIGYVDTGYYSNRIIIPVTLGNQLRTFVARSILNDADIKVLTPKDGKTGLFGSQFCSPKKGPIILVEGWADKFRIDSLGYPNCVSIQMNRLQPDQFTFVKQFPYAIVIPDNDAGGDILINSLSVYIEEYVFLIGQLEKSKDPGEASTEELIRVFNNLGEWKPVVKNQIEIKV